MADYVIVTGGNFKSLRFFGRFQDMPQRHFSTALNAMRVGTGGRSSFNGIVATVFGASGFVGRNVVSRIARTGTQVILPYRGDESDVFNLKLCGDLGQVLLHPFHLRDETSIRKAVKYSNVVINLIGREFETKNFPFKDVHVDGARRIARIAREMGVKRLIHFSALNACRKPKPCILPLGSKLLKSKWEGEMAVREEFPTAVIFRPSDMYGERDRFLHYYSNWWRRQFYCVPLWKDGEETFKMPVFVSDVADCVSKVIMNPDTDGQIIQAVGPRKYKLGELVDYIYAVARRDASTGYHRYDMKYDPIFKLKVTLSEKLAHPRPYKMVHWERIERECVTDTVDITVPTLEDFGVILTPLEEQIDLEVEMYRAYAYYQESIGEYKPAPPPPHY